jgi:hypothetical protein
MIHGLSLRRAVVPSEKNDGMNIIALLAIK